MLTMTTEADLMRAVLEDPDDDARRLVYADRLEEQGENDRAEFVRWQIGGRAAPVLCHVLGTGVINTEWRCHPTDTANPFCPRWREMILKGLGEPYLPAGSAFVFRRGFVDEVSVGWIGFDYAAWLLFTEYPITRVRFAGDDRFPNEWAGYDWVQVGWPSPRGGKRASRPGKVEARYWPAVLYPGASKGSLATQYESESAAYDDLSRRLVAEGRRRAGPPAPAL